MLKTLRHLAPGIDLLAEHVLGDMFVWYVHDCESGRVGLWLLPTASREHIVERRDYLATRPARNLFRGRAPGQLRAWTVDGMVQVAARRGESHVGRGQGRSLRRGPASESLGFVTQDRCDAEGRCVITTTLSGSGLHVVHILSHVAGDPFIKVRTELSNHGTEAVAIDLLSAFSLGGITPFAADDAPERLVLHRFRSGWSAEGRHVAELLEDLHLERSWAGFNQSCERFGHSGSRPVTRFFPQTVIEDRVAGVCWGANIPCEGSWQIEVFRQDDLVNVSGGWADRETGHWTKLLQAGETLVTPEATLTVAKADLDATCQRLTAAQTRACNDQPSIEADLPICFNEFCTTWTNPTHDRMVSLADHLQGLGVTYLVIDDGWSRAANGAGHVSGDWIPDEKRFPHGLAATAKAIRDRGLIPGIWFEWEVARSPSQAAEDVRELIHRDGLVLTAGTRRFLDMRKKSAWEGVDRRMLSLLRAAQFGFLKLDYNEDIGFGIDQADSPGEGLRQHMRAVHDYLRHLRRELPDLVIENCSSGGHRLEPAFQGICAMGSFSDAHETDSIPIIAANLHRLILPRQSLVWAVLRTDDDEQRLVANLAATFLGRMCLSGEVDGLAPWAKGVLAAATSLYRLCVPIIREGSSHFFGPIIRSYNTPHGWQAIRRDGAGRCLVVVHRFTENEAIQVPLPSGSWRIVASLNDTATVLQISGQSLDIINERDGFSGAVALLETDGATRPL